MGILNIFRRSIKVVKNIPIRNTKFPICPWCGLVYTNYEDFLLGDRETLCCKQNTEREFTVVRYGRNYSTQRVL